MILFRKVVKTFVFLIWTWKSIISIKKISSIVLSLAKSDILKAKRELALSYLNFLEMGTDYFDKNPEDLQRLLKLSTSNNMEDINSIYEEIMEIYSTTPTSLPN